MSIVHRPLTLSSVLQSSECQFKKKKKEEDEVIMLYQQTAVLVGTGSTEWLALLSSAVIAKGMRSSHFILIPVLVWSDRGALTLPRPTDAPSLPRHQIWLVNVSGMSVSHLSAGKRKGHTWIPRLEDYLIQAQFSQRYISAVSVVGPAELAWALGGVSPTGAQPSNSSKHDNDDESRRAGRCNVLSFTHNYFSF